MFRPYTVLALLGAFVASNAELPPGCQESVSMPATQFDALHEQLKKTENKFPLFLRLYDLEQYVNDPKEMQGYGFSPQQTVLLGSLFNDGGLVEQLVLDGALTALGPHTLGLACTDGAKILDLSTSQNTRIDILKAVVNVTLDLENASDIYVQKFDGFLYQEAAKEIIESATPYGCAFGNTSVVKRLAFVIDTSGSMSTTFPGPSGAPVSRLTFVREQLISQLQSHLLPDQEFNIIDFSSTATAWKPGVQPVTPSSITQASDFAKTFTASGGTQMLKGLNLAMNDPKVQGIYLLTDGAPAEPTSKIVEAVTAWSKGKKPVFPTAFMAGTQGDWMQELADKTGGIFRKINS